MTSGHPNSSQNSSLQNRRLLIFGLVFIAAAVLLWRVVALQVLNKEFLQNQGDARYLRVVDIAAHRGNITDRNGEPLAISIPVDSIWANPHELMTAPESWPEIASLLGMTNEDFKRRIAGHAKRGFVYLKRQAHPDTARKVIALGVPGVSLQREYRRYYPTGEVGAHVIGFTNVDDKGQEGLELAYDEWLSGKTGTKRVLKDRLGRVIENVESLTKEEPGADLALSLDKNIQYLAYRELKASVNSHRAKSGSVLVLDVNTGEVLAMANQPGYNPNNREKLTSSAFRNRAVTDVFEPGSAIKPFTIAAALESEKYQASTTVDTSPGIFRVGNNVVRDLRDYGRLSLGGIIQKSSNVGASKVALSISPRQLWNVFSKVGFGEITGSGFPGESVGLLSDYSDWGEIERATLAFGYGLAVTPIQLARAYMMLANGGLQQPLTFELTDRPSMKTRVLKKETARQMIKMLESVAGEGGTGKLARVPGYSVAGKTGTVRKYAVGGYVDDKYLAVFAGMAPASNPRVVIVVMVNEPRVGDYYGGEVAAPIFARVMAGTLRQLGVAPDDVEISTHRLTRSGSDYHSTDKATSLSELPVSMLSQG